MVLTLYKVDASPPVRTVLMTIEALKIPDVKYIDISLKQKEHLKEEYIKINPQHTVPLLKDDDFFIWDSHAIGAYLVTKYGKDDSLYPNDPRKRAVVNQRLHFDSSVLFPTLRATFGVPILLEGEKEIRPENIDKVKSAYDFLEKFLTADWLAGDHVTLADICCIATVSSMDVLVPVESSEYPKVAAWFERCSQQEFYKKGNENSLKEFKDLVKSKLG